MPRARCRRNHIRHKLVVSRARPRLHDSHSSVLIESCILAAVPEIDEVSGGVVEKAVRIRLDFEVLNQIEGLALENPQMTIEAGHVEFVEVAAQK